MRFNKQELTTLATQPSQKFDKEGVLFLRERQEGFFRRSERKDNKRGKRSKSLRELSCYSGPSKVSLERWCRLRGNLLFYFKSREQWSEPLGVIILEQCSIKVDSPSVEGPYGFHLVFDGGLSQHLAAYSQGERDAWLQAIQLASYECMRSQLLALQQRMELRRGHDPHLDIHMWRIRHGHSVDPSELPLCEISLACDNLLCDGHGRSPNPVLAVHVFIPSERVWMKYGKTEVVERSSNPCFLNTISFRASDGLGTDTRVRLTAFDVREHVSQTAIPIGSAIVTLGKIQEADRLRIPLQSASGTTVGFLSISVWNLEPEDKGGSTESTPCRSVPEHEVSAQVYSHRRSQSLPPRLGTRMKLPNQGHLPQLFASPYVQTYRFHSGLGGDICVHELMAESRLCFQFPQQLLALWIQEEKELLQEVAGMGELREPWHSRQVELLDRHLQLLHLYSQAKENLAVHRGSFFKPSSRKNDRTLEFAPVNLHLQRMWVQNDTLRKSGFYDIITVGAFTAHSHKSKNGGLIKLLQQLKESPSKQNSNLQGPTKISMAHDAIQAIKQLRREVVDGMRALMKLAKEKQTAGMLPICEDMITKTRILLSLWDPGLVEEALSFIEEHKVAQPIVNESAEGEDGLCSLELHQQQQQTLSPYRRITQQLNFDLKSPDIDDLVTPDTPQCTRTFWNIPTSNSSAKMCSTNSADKEGGTSQSNRDSQFIIFPDAEEDIDREANELKEKENDDSGVENEENIHSNEASGTDETKQMILPNGYDSDIGRRFLDTQVMCSSPSANYYKPTDEPEPWDLTQLNIEASVMCLVSKVKFLCGRCGSPAVRLRSSQRGVGRSRSFRSGLSTKEVKDSETTKTESVVTVQPTSNTPLSNGKDGNSQTESICSSSKAKSESDKVNSEDSLGFNASMSSDDVLNKTVDTVQKAVNGATNRNGATVRNKFTEGLDFASIVDWTCELRPSMRKLRQAMDGLLKTARLTHSVFRVQEDSRLAQRACNVRYRRDVCFSQSLTSLVTGLMAKLWCQKPDPTFLLVLTTLGPLVSFEGLLSYYGDEIDMWGDMTVAVEDLVTVKFTLTRSPNNCRSGSQQQEAGQPQLPAPRVTGSRTALTVLLPVPDAVYSMLPLSHPGADTVSFNITPVYFNIGINEMATLAESLGSTRPQEKSNVDNFDRLNEYYHRFRKLNIPADMAGHRGQSCAPLQMNLGDLVEKLRQAVHTRQSKNVQVLHLSSHICRRMKGLRFTSCKSAKDRTGMSVTLEQCQILVTEYDLAEHEFRRALDCMRSEGSRRENTNKNTGVRKYAFNSLQLLTLPKEYRPPAGTYGSAQT
ncbi:inositol polyphosphate-4-phosphatase type I A isoform X1 [Schistocerca americana]|uniref:inositol polyphosphate-4-phosphatase type I A isoform X1 n=2 Tax=Schistocerca americana TaxID=7009 RepID=UPI001F4F2915|nr:inositol polyphosphate-4-phosphatase type I A isoform X1 [Schistocerca americana]